MDKVIKLVVFFSLCLCGSSAPAFDAVDEHALQLALRALKMTERDLGFSKTNVESELMLPNARRFLQEPQDFPNYAEALLSNCASVADLGKLTGFSAQQLQLAPSVLRIKHRLVTVAPDFLAKLPVPVAEAIQRITTSASSSAAVMNHATPTNATSALAGFASEALHIDKDKDEITSWQKLGVDTTALKAVLNANEHLELQDTDLADSVLNIADEFNLVTMMQASQGLAGTVDKAIASLRTTTFTGDFQYETDTELGKIFIGGSGLNTYSNEAFLIIDLGGDDVYLNSAGGANGLAGRPISIVIDMGGNDQFISKRSFSQGSGVFGIGILAALGSNSTFQAKHFSQGAGFFGCGILMTGTGKQTFEADTFCQGAGMFGTGILWQRGGETTYTANKYAQGFGGVQGCGLLLDGAGNDHYVAGGKEPCGWLPGHFFSLSQGFGYGMRPYAGGGIGILCDLKGDDHYKADVYGQGASYWYALGLLLDAEGNDTYEAHQYCQGAGIHLSTGALIDWVGDDSYTAGQICQGAAHDYAVGMLIDRAGNDCYTGKTTAQGAAINNSFALLLDRAGDDTYTGADPNQSQASGHDGDKRQYGSIALLLDLAGRDTYSQGQSNNAAWLKPFYGAGLDAEIGSAPTRRRFAVPAPESGSKLPHSTTGRLYTVARVDPYHPIERLFRVATSDRPDAGTAWDELKHRAAESLPYLIPRLSSPNIMVRVKFEQLVDHLDTNSIPLLSAGIRATTDDEVARLCCYFLARFNEKARSAIPAVLPLLKRDKTRTTAFYTLGHLRAVEAFTPAVRALNDPKELIRLRATQALGKICSATATNLGVASAPRPSTLTPHQRRAIPYLLTKLDDEFYDVRYAAQDALVAFGKPALPHLRDNYPKATTRAKPHLLEARAKLGDRTALDLAHQFYRNEDPLVRDAVLRSLTERLQPPP